MISKELLDILVCPENHSSLALADNALIERLNRAIAAGTLTNRAGQAVDTQLGGGLIREDRRVLYPIVDGIPVLLVDEAIVLDQLGSCENTNGPGKGNDG